MSIVALDVDYDDARSRGSAAAVLFGDWEEQAPASEYLSVVEDVAPYVPGEFFRRELPCLLAVIRTIDRPFDVLVIDGYVRLGDRPALGQHLYEALAKRIPIIGVAKTPFHEAPAIEVLRGRSRSPLYVTAAGIDAGEATRCISMMHGRHRIPTMLKRADRLARGG